MEELRKITKELRITDIQSGFQPGTFRIRRSANHATVTFCMRLIMPILCWTLFTVWDVFDMHYVSRVFCALSFRYWCHYTNTPLISFISWSVAAIEFFSRLVLKPIIRPPLRPIYTVSTNHKVLSSIFASIETVTKLHASRSQQNRRTLQNEQRSPGEWRQLATRNVAKLATLYC
jgi:hypothetical protein